MSGCSQHDVLHSNHIHQPPHVHRAVLLISACSSCRGGTNARIPDYKILALTKHHAGLPFPVPASTKREGVVTNIKVFETPSSGIEQQALLSVRLRQFFK